jgi:hypothetical protein
MHDVATLPAEDAVKGIFAGHSEALLSPLAKTAKFPSVIPASGFLAEISTQGPLVSELGACHF